MDLFPIKDVDNLLSDHKLSYQNGYEYGTDQLKLLYNNRIKLCAQKLDEKYKISKQLSDVNTTINEGHNTVKCMEEKIKSEQESLHAEHISLETINNECSLWEIEENQLKSKVNEHKVQLTKVFKEKKEYIKNIKRQIKAFQCGMNMYEKFLQLGMIVENREANSIVKITMKTSNFSDYNITLEENDNDFKLIEIIPHIQHIDKVAELYNQNKDIQGLLAYLYFLTKE